MTLLSGPSFIEWQVTTSELMTSYGESEIILVHSGNIFYSAPGSDLNPLTPLLLLSLLLLSLQTRFAQHMFYLAHKIWHRGQVERGWRICDAIATVSLQQLCCPGIYGNVVAVMRWWYGSKLHFNRRSRQTETILSLPHLRPSVVRLGFFDSNIYSSRNNLFWPGIILNSASISPLALYHFMTSWSGWVWGWMDLYKHLKRESLIDLQHIWKK